MYCAIALFFLLTDVPVQGGYCPIHLLLANSQNSSGLDQIVQNALAWRRVALPFCCEVVSEEIGILHNVLGRSVANNIVLAYQLVEEFGLMVVEERIVDDCNHSLVEL